MIKVEKTGNDVAISEVIGSTYDLIYEFHVALKAIYRVLDGSIATRVSTGDECSIIIEDGYVVGQKTPEEPEKKEWKAGTF